MGREFDHAAFLQAEACEICNPLSSQGSYHGWRFSGEGKITALPQATEVGAHHIQERMLERKRRVHHLGIQ